MIKSFRGSKKVFLGSGLACGPLVVDPFSKLKNREEFTCKKEKNKENLKRNASERNLFKRRVSKYDFIDVLIPFYKFIVIVVIETFVR